ncbi:sulfotransferase family 2 domain-containing protein [Rhodoblastus sp.]|uniref:sulfotransferase family 2 domain-containing protein n=1 Tax=Rhodoblastus sp. TaxID=1962975 RepID=UPI0026128353|nr:sulfotransferase family 2 domain-containing protein [Rhodoblastus sp.]
MLISNSKRFIFVHIPKSGGTSITRLLDRELEWNDIVLGGTKVGEVFKDVWAPRFRIDKHSLPSEIETVISKDLYTTYTKFVVVRDPVDRFLSAFNFVRTLIDSRAEWFLRSLEYKAMDRLESPEQFYASKYLRDAFATDPIHAHEIRRWFMPQSIYWDAEEAVNGRFLYFTLDSLAQSTRPLQDAGLIRSEHELTRENKSTTYHGSVTSEIRAQLQRTYDKDYCIFKF